MVRLTIVRNLSVLIVVCAGAAFAQEPAPDSLTRQLFDQYTRGGKIDGKSQLAAIHLIAARGRYDGFWKEVLTALKTHEPGDGNHRYPEINCLKILGKMLEQDAYARMAIERQRETGEIGAMVPVIALRPEVVTTLIDRGRKADRLLVEHYSIALARARVPETREFLKSLLPVVASGPARVPEGDLFAPRPQSTTRKPAQAPEPRAVNHMPTTQFHAAIGLALLGESEGIDWLVKNSTQTEFNQGDVQHSVPFGLGRRHQISDCCVAALQQLSDQNLTTKEEWGAWASTVDKKTLLRKRIVLEDQ